MTIYIESKRRTASLAMLLHLSFMLDLLTRSARNVDVFTHTSVAIQAGHQKQIHSLLLASSHRDRADVVSTP